MSTTFAQRLLDPGPVVCLSGSGGPRSVAWGHPWQIGTAAYWIEGARHDTATVADSQRHRLGRNLREELAACILGGFGMPFEVALSYFQAVRDGLLEEHVAPTAALIESVLREPRTIGTAVRRYRFPKQRATRLAEALKYIENTSTDSMATREMRDWLLGAPGVGMKTASWIVRNVRVADDLAVLDIHVLRAGRRARVFPIDLSVERHYRELEDWFVDWARIGCVSAADLDAVIWSDQAYWARHR